MHGDSMTFSQTFTGRTNIEGVESVLRSRHSCRSFRPERIDEQLIWRICEIAQLTPSWCNVQPWLVTVTAGPATDRFRAVLAAHARQHAPTPDIVFPEYRGVYRQRRRAAGLQLYDSINITAAGPGAWARQAAANFDLFGAPHVAIVTTDRALGVYGAIDCGGYVNNFMLIAGQLGVATVAQAAIAAHSEFVRRHFEMPPERQVVCGISFGYEDGSHPINAFRTPRASARGVVALLDS